MSTPTENTLWAAVLDAAEFRWSTGEYTKAEELFRHAIALAEEALSCDHPEVIIAYMSLADFMCERQRFGEAETIYRFCLKLIARQCGSDGLLFALALRNLGEILTLENQDKDAILLRQRANQVLKACQIIFSA